jgi:hypothetical protein
MERPDICPVEVYEMMLDCWEQVPYNRPMFAQLADRMEKFMQAQCADSNYDPFPDVFDGKKVDDYEEPVEMSNGMVQNNHTNNSRTYAPPAIDDEEDYEDGETARILPNSDVMYSNMPAPAGKGKQLEAADEENYLLPSESGSASRYPSENSAGGYPRYVKEPTADEDPNYVQGSIV